MSRLFSIVVVALLCTQLAHAERTTTYYHTDSLGSVVAASNQAGALLWRKDYAPFGAQTDSTDEKEKIAYTGKEHDDVSRLTYFGARYYDPNLGRFLSIDPAGVDPANPLSFNRYAYANNNPYRFIDPDGREACDLPECKAYDEDTRQVYDRGAKGVREGGSELSDVVSEEASNPWNWIPVINGAKKAERAATATRFVVNSAGKAQLVVKGLRVGEHAALRMTERGVSISALEKTLAQKPFKYFHDGAWKTGYYDPASRIFAGSIKGELTTIINGATPRYIENLMRAAPP